MTGWDSSPWGSRTYYVPRSAEEFLTIIEEPDYATIVEEGMTSMIIEAPSVVTVIADPEVIAYAPPLTVAVVYEALNYLTVSDVGVQGPPGPQGVQGIPGPQNLFVQSGAPVTSEPTYMWIQTGLGPGLDEYTIWFEDGL
jgi:hypothetical protein